MLCAVTERRRGASTQIGMSAPRLIVVPRWGASPSDDFYPWLADQIVGLEVLSLPNPPTLESWMHGVRQAIGEDPYALARTLVIAHSVGAMTTLRAAAELPPGRAISRLLCVAGWATLDEPWAEIRPWLDTPLDVERVKGGVQNVRVLLSDNDPFTSDYESNGRWWREQLEAEVEVIPGAGHFNAPEQPVVIEHIKDLFGRL